MSSLSPIASKPQTFSLTSKAAAAKYHPAPAEPSNIKTLDNQARIDRANNLLYTNTKQEYAYSQTIQIPKSKDSREAVPLKLEFNFNIDSLLTRCISALNHAGFRVKEKVFKGGAIHYVMDGYPATLRDFDISLVIEHPKGDPIEQWKKINEYHPKKP